MCFLLVFVVYSMLFLLYVFCFDCSVSFSKKGRSKPKTCKKACYLAVVFHFSFKTRTLRYLTVSHKNLESAMFFSFGETCFTYHMVQKV